MKKLLIVMLIISMLSMSLASCGGNNAGGNDGKDTTKDTTRDTTMDVEDGKVSDTGKDKNSIINDVESGVAGLESDIMK